MKTVYFDTLLRTRKGVKAYYETAEVSNATDGELVWFHSAYGLMRLYRLHEVDCDNFVAEDLRVVCSTKSELWRSWGENPSLALNV